jgi:outer membrane lipopolysaccharide assembly protein LptE/RlpB
VAVGFLGGCGYALVGKASNIPDDVRLVYLEAFENRTSRAEVEQFLSQALAEELVTRQRFSLVAERSEADAVLRGAVIGFRVLPITFDAEGRGQEYEISITTEVAFVRTDDDETALWSNNRYLFKESYDLSGDEASFFDRENIAIEESAGRFAETMVTDLLEGF